MYLLKTSITLLSSTTVVALFILAAMLAVLASGSSKVGAQNCSEAVDPAKGRVVYDVRIPEAGEYRIWTRIQAANDHNNSVWLKVNNTCPINVGDTDVPANGWKWVPYRDGSTDKQIKVGLESGEHKLRYFGREKDVKIDTVVLLKDTDCTPEGKDGKNCQIVQPTESGNNSNGSGQTQEDDANTINTEETSASYTPWLIGLGAAVALSGGGIIYTAVRPEQARHIVAYQHKLVNKIKRLFGKGGPPPDSNNAGGAAPDGPTIIHPSN